MKLRQVEVLQGQGMSVAEAVRQVEQPRNRNTIISRPMRFDMICEANGIEHRLTKPNHPWTNGQVERMNRTIKDTTVKRFHYDSHD
jgi:transposase InsO family protein